MVKLFSRQKLLLLADRYSCLPQAHKHRLALQCSADILCCLHAYAQNFRLPGADVNRTIGQAAHHGSKARESSSGVSERSRPVAGSSECDHFGTLHGAGNTTGNQEGVKANIGTGSMAASAQSKVLLLLASLMSSTKHQNSFCSRLTPRAPRVMASTFGVS